MEEFDIELFISEIKKFPELWNVASEEHFDRQKKRAAWISVCRVFCEDFEEKNDKAKNEICNKFIQKWKNIKDTYTKSEKKKLKSGQAANSGKRYVYARQLSFLQVAGATTETQSSLNNEIVEDVETSVEQPESHNNTLQSGTPRYNQKSTKKRKRDIESSLIDFMNAPIPSNSPIVSEINPDRSFFESILPSISGFTEDQKLEFRSEILNIIKRMRTQPNLHQYGHIPNIIQYQPNLGPAALYQTSSNNLTRPQLNQYPIQTIQIQTPTPIQIPQIPNTGNIENQISPTSSSSTTLDIQTYREEDTLDIFRDGI